MNKYVIGVDEVCVYITGLNNLKISIYLLRSGISLQAHARNYNSNCSVL